MDDRVFTFAGLINPSHTFITEFHVILVALIVIILGKMATSRMQQVPGGLQNMWEMLFEGILSVADGVIGRKYALKYFPLAASIAIIVFVSNLIGIIPGFESPTATISFTLTLALIVFVYYNFEGIRKNGIISYFAHFSGPVLILAPLMFPVELISHFSRIISLSFRLFGNIKGDDMFLLVMLMLVPYIAPLPAFAILLFMAVLQAFVFMILTYVYLQGAIMLDED